MNRNRVLGFIILLAVSLLFLWAFITGGMADLAAAILSPAYLEEAS